MADREKVINGIERCICHVPDACRDCGYDAGQPYNVCVESLLKDALALLKEQEPVEPTVICDENEIVVGLKCGHCGWKVDALDRYCAHCGRSVKL